jgi:hypothetical protein
MEKELLYLLDWNLNFEQSELEYHFEPFLARIRDSMAQLVVRQESLSKFPETKFDLHAQLQEKKSV